MNNVSIFWLQLLVSVGVVTIIAVLYVWPALRKKSRNAALIPLIFVHVGRYIGMTLLVSYMIDQKLPRDFLNAAAYGDLIAATLALASILALRSTWRLAIPLVWVFNTWGFVDLLNGVRGVVQIDVPTYDLGSCWFIYTFYAPVVLVSHVMIFMILLKSKAWKTVAIAP